MHHKHTLASAGDHSLLLARPESGTSRRKLVLATDWTTLVTGEKVWTRTQTPAHTAGWVDEVTPDGSIAWIVTSGAIRRMYHHSDGDTMDKLNPREMAECVAVMAVMAYVAADMPGTFGRVAPAAAR